jgi:hypothetical protein
MVKHANARRFALLACLGLLLASSGGCTLVHGFAVVAANFSWFWKTTPLIPVSSYYSQLIEDTYWEEERYDRVPILDPVEGEHAPLFCIDPPSPDHVYRSLPNRPGGGLTFVAETAWNNVRMVVELIDDRIGECRFYPMVGPARMKICKYKCTVYYDKTIRSDWPVPFSHTDQVIEVVYIDKNHLIRCAGPPQDLEPVTFP